MGLELYQAIPAFRSIVDQCAELLINEWGIDLRSIMFARENHTKSATSALQQASNAQLTLFVIEYALAKILIKWGIRPQSMIGHSIGEYVAACLAGVFSLKDVLFIIVTRGKLMQKLPGGAMLAVTQSEREIRLHLEDNLSLAALNSPCLCVVSGKFETIEKYEKKLTNMNISHHRIHTSHAFHSQMMDPILIEFTEQVKKVNLKSPQIPFISNVTGTWIKKEEATDPNYWARHLRNTVRFSDGLKVMLQGENLILVEVGPGQTLTTLARQHDDKHSKHLFINTLPHPSDRRSDAEILLTSLGHIWCQGIDIDWQSLYFNSGCQRIPLPTYPFERKRFWIEPKTANMVDSNIPNQTHKKREITEWFYRPVWRKSNLKNEYARVDLKSKRKNWLFFIDQCKIGQQIVKKLDDANQDVTIVRIADHFTKLNKNTFCLNPSEYDHYKALFENLQEMGKTIQIICHLWGITSNKFTHLSIRSINQIQKQVFNSLLNIVQVFSRQNGEDPLRIELVTNNMQKVKNSDEICPEKSIIMGPCRVIPKEYPGITCRSIDICIPECQSNQMQNLLDLLIQELSNSPNESIIAFRGEDRWIEAFEPLAFNGQTSEATRFRQSGVYLITGGLGGVGLQLAEHLSSTFHAKLVLIQRSVFPPPKKWDEWLKTHDKHDNVSRKIRKIRKLQILGGKILVLSADVTDIENMSGAIHQAENVFGRINGVIHCAGIPDGALINRRKAEMTDMVMAPKVKGTLVIDKIFKERALDFFILFSSLSSYLAPVGQVGYTAANAFLNAFAHYKSDQGNSYTLAIGWDAWKGVGMAANRPKLYTSPTTEPQVGSAKTSHPLLDRFVGGTSKEKIYESLLSVDDHWLLNEHRILNRATLPGTAFLEMVRAAFVQNTNYESITIREIYFLNPLSLANDEKRVVRVTLTDHGDHHKFSIKSNTVSKKDLWKVHAQGEVTFLESGPIHTMNIQKIKEKTHSKDLLMSENAISMTKYLTYGSRWRNINWIQFGENEGLAELELPETYAEDFKHYKLHPALFDIATGFMGIGMSKKNLYLPFYFKNIAIRGPLPQKIISYVKSTSKAAAAKQTLSFSISVMDKHGRQLIQVEQYTLRKVDSKVFSELKSNAKAKRKVENIRLEIKSPGILDSLKFRSSIRNKPLPHEVEIEVSATGLNFKDVLMVLGMIPPVEEPPIELGMEFAGRIVRVGEKVDSFNIGDVVMGFANSSFSHYVNTPAALVAPIPSNLNVEEGAIIPVAYLTAYYALMILGKLRNGERVLIHSATGGVGMAALKIARWREAEIFATAGTPKKRDFLSSIGIKNVYDSRSLDFVDEILADSGNEGVNVVLNSLSGKFIPKSLSILAPYGRFLEIGMRDILLNHRINLGLFAKNATFHAIMMRPEMPNFTSYWHDVVELFENNVLDLMPFKLFPLARASDAFKYMTTGEHIGKIILSHPNGDALADLIMREDKINRNKIERFITDYRSNNTPHHYSAQEISYTPENDLLEHNYPKQFFEVGVFPEEGVEILKRSISCALPHILISTHDLTKRMKDSKTITIKRITQALEKMPKPEKKHPRPILGTKYVAPRNRTEEKVAEIWQQLLGIDKVGIYDNFFALGGHSLLAAQIYAQLRKHFEIEFPIDSMFEEPNVATLAEMIESILETEN
jgi:acyl transferase domain-containing protein/Zn-dependent alcohol dehydrogenase/acyl carrier protein